MAAPPQHEGAAVVEVTTADLLATIEDLLEWRPEDEPRVLVGLVGPPGTGKSTLANALAAELGEPRAAVLAMDGFHLASNLLAGTELAERRGAIDTFDAGGFASLVERLRANAEDEVHAPTFERDLEEPVNASQTIPRSCEVVLVEGNYLLADGADWRRVRECLDEAWFLHSDPQARRSRLEERHVRFGKDPAEAARWTRGSDEANAELVLSTADRADRQLAVRLSEAEVGGEHPAD